MEVSLHSRAVTIILTLLLEVLSAFLSDGIGMPTLHLDHKMLVFILWFEFATARNQPIVWSYWGHPSFRETIDGNSTRYNPITECQIQSTFHTITRGHDELFPTTLRTSAILVLVSIDGGQ